MSSNIRVQRICTFCNNEFTARKTTTLYCSHKCSRAAYKAKIRGVKVEASNTATFQIKTKSIDVLKAKEFLTVKDAALLLNCSIRTVYRLIDLGSIHSFNLSERKTTIRRSDIDKLFEQSEPKAMLPEINTNTEQYEITDCYQLNEVQTKYGISQTGLQDLIRRHKIPKFRKRAFAYVPKVIIDKLLKQNNKNGN